MGKCCIAQKEGKKPKLQAQAHHNYKQRKIYIVMISFSHHKHLLIEKKVVA